MTASPARYASSVLSLVRADVIEGAVPASVTSFSELHSHTDANEYLIDVLPEPFDLDLTNEVTDLVDAGIKRGEHGQILSGMVRLSLVEDMLGDLALADVERGHAGGTVALWAVSVYTGHVICITEKDGPFTDVDFPEVDGFCVGVYAGGREEYLDGDEANPTLTEVPANLWSLHAALTEAVQLKILR